MIPSLIKAANLAILGVMAVLNKKTNAYNVIIAQIIA